MSMMTWRELVFWYVSFFFGMVGRERRRKMNWMIGERETEESEESVNFFFGMVGRERRRKMNWMIGKREVEESEESGRV